MEIKNLTLLEKLGCDYLAERMKEEIAARSKAQSLSQTFKNL